MGYKLLLRIKELRRKTKKLLRINVTVFLVTIEKIPTAKGPWW